MPNYSASGEENLRADPSVMVGDTKESPGGKGEDAGGDAVNTKTLADRGKGTPDKGLGRPAGVQSFDDDMGRN